MGKLQKLTKGIKIFFNYFLGPVLFAWIILSIYHQLREQENLEAAVLQMSNAFSGEHAWKMLGVVLLMPVNWMLETLKWYVLINREYRFSFVKAFQSVLSGLTLAVNTPNRIGEYGGRVLYLEAPYRLKGVLLTMVASLSQLLVTLLLGGLALFWLKPQVLAAGYDVFPDAKQWYNLFVLVLTVITLLTAIFYFRLQWLVKWLRRLPWVKLKFPFTETVENLPLRTNLELLLYSCIRFIVFAVQYVLIWQALGLELSFTDGFMGVALMFVLMAVVPTIALVELGLRGKVALTVMGVFSANTAAILTGTIGIWVLNLIIPALAGSLLLLTVKVFREK